MQTQLGRFNSETLQVPAKSPSNSRVTNGLIRGNKLARALPFRNRLEIKSLESGCILNITKHLLSNSTGHTELDNYKITTSSPLRSWTFLLFKTLIIMKPFLREISLLILDTSLNHNSPICFGREHSRLQSIFQSLKQVVKRSVPECPKSRMKNI